MEEIRNLYAKVQDKDFFKENLAKVLNLKKTSVECCLAKNGKFRSCFLETIKNCLKIQLQIDEQTKDINVKAWELLK